MNDPIVIVSAVRTPMGGFQGDLKGLTAPQLGSAAIRAAVERAGIAADAVDEVLFGCVLPAAWARRPRVKPPWAPGWISQHVAPPSTRCAARAWKRPSSPMIRCWPAASTW